MEKHNPYAAPQAKLADAARPAGSPLKAVAFGFLTDVVGTLIGGGILGAIYGGYLASQGATTAEIISATQEASAGSWLLYASEAIGAVFSVLGGYVCARVARHREYRFAAIVAVLSSIAGLVLGAELSLESALSTVVTVVSILAGAHWGYRRNRRQPI